MASFKRFSNWLLGFSLLAVGAVACSIQVSADFGAGAFDGNENLSGAGGETSSGVLVPPPDDATAGAMSYGHMCGGGCMSGEKIIACSFPMNPDSPPASSCKIVPSQFGPVAECLASGKAQEGEPCTKALDCAASLGCVRTGPDVSVCLPYCCGDIEACVPGTYCALVPMHEDVLNKIPIQIPVCAAAIPCTLLDDETCTDGRTCTLVRADGTTSCVVPGPGQVGDPCPCSAGHVCSLSAGTCLKLCQFGGKDCPESMFCQGGSESFPSGVGVCVN